MKKILLTLIVYFSLYAPPHQMHLAALVREFKECSPRNVHTFLPRLHEYGMDAPSFIYYLADYKKECALIRCQEEFNLTTMDVNNLSYQPTIQYSPTHQMTYSLRNVYPTDVPKLATIMRNAPFLWPINLILYCGVPEPRASVTPNPHNSNDTYNLFLPRSFLNYSHDAQIAILSHERIHLILQHSKKIAFLRKKIAIPCCTNQGSYQSNAYLGSKITNNAILKFIRAQEYEADFLALLSVENPRMIARGMRQILRGPSSDVYHPSNPKRRNWTTKLTDLLYAEKQYRQRMNILKVSCF